MYPECLNEVGITGEPEDIDSLTVLLAIDPEKPFHLLTPLQPADDPVHLWGTPREPVCICEPFRKVSPTQITACYTTKNHPALAVWIATTSELPSLIVSVDYDEQIANFAGRARIQHGHITIEEKGLSKTECSVCSTLDYANLMFAYETQESEGTFCSAHFDQGWDEYAESEENITEQWDTATFHEMLLLLDASPTLSVHEFLTHHADALPRLGTALLTQEEIPPDLPSFLDSLASIGQPSVEQSEGDTGS